MVMEGVDIDINFGKPISAGEYLHSSRRIEEMLADGGSYLREGGKGLSALGTLDIRMMQEYMNSIYGMTTVNHDHLFSYILTRHKKAGSAKTILKTAPSWRIDILRKAASPIIHTALQKKQFYLLTDDYHEKYVELHRSGRDRRPHHREGRHHPQKPAAASPRCTISTRSGRTTSSRC